MLANEAPQGGVSARGIGLIPPRKNMSEIHMDRSESTGGVRRCAARYTALIEVEVPLCPTMPSTKLRHGAGKKDAP